MGWDGCTDRLAPYSAAPFSPSLKGKQSLAEVPKMQSEMKTA